MPNPPADLRRDEAEPFAELHETHTGVVVLYGDRAYKTKRPVVTDFLDFGTVERRRLALSRELELNRRLAPDVYLGVGSLDQPGGDAEPVLVMRRLPEHARLTRQLADPAAAGSMLTRLVHRLTDFHDHADRNRAVNAAATVAAVRARWQSVLAGLTDPPLGAAEVAVVRRLAERYLDGREALFDQRIATGRIVDGHGDLRADDIFVLPDGFRIIDCLEFDDGLRYVDRVDDIAFLVMDLEFHGAPWVAVHVLERYLTCAGDPAPMSLCHHYIAYRALVRAKVQCVRHGQGDPDAEPNARRHLDICRRHLESGAVRVGIVGGLPGTGTSTVAAGLAAGTGAVLLSSDRVRAELRATGVITGDSGEFGAGAYAASAVDRVYAELADRAHEHLVHGRSVVLDATWTAAHHREQILRLAARTSAVPIELCCRAPQVVSQARITERRAGVSEATPEIADALAAQADPWPAARSLDTTEPPSMTVARALAEWGVADCW
ncbi:hypothetical protein EBN03_18185 [Nocardia stercoris]|uniref:Gluconate kinase n=1 Tax=Nocardia stercoris TaxID=2483361 RepID=A0A3M2L259_9NOCA|nr:hypothetical protein EBN03_18185 [Nocardia stercoris]